MQSQSPVSCTLLCSQVRTTWLVDYYHPYRRLFAATSRFRNIVPETNKPVLESMSYTKSAATYVQRWESICLLS